MKSAYSDRYQLLIKTWLC